MYRITTYVDTFDKLKKQDFKNMRALRASLVELRKVKTTDYHIHNNAWARMYEEYKQLLIKYRRRLKLRAHTTRCLTRIVHGQPVTAMLHGRTRLDLQNAKTELNANIREMRGLSRQVYRARQVHELRSGAIVNSYRVGLVHHESGFWERQLHVQQVQDVFRAKRPQDNNKHLGIELEFYCDSDRDTLAYNLFKAGLRQYVQLKSDGSIRPRTNSQYPHELCLLVPEGARNTIVRKVCQVLKHANAEVNKSCGMHVHIDMRDRDREVVFHNLVSSQSILYAMNPKSRLHPGSNGTVYCKRTRTKKFTTRIDRYHGINPRAYTEHTTLEVRIHSGTISYEKISNWLDILVAIANRRTKVEKTRRSIRSFAQDFGIDNSVQTYIKSRIDKFKIRNEEAEAA